MTNPLRRALIGLAAVLLLDGLLILLGVDRTTITVANAIGGYLVATFALPERVFDLRTMRARLRGAGLVVAIAVAWWVAAIVATSVLAHITTTDAAGHVGAGLLALGCYPLGLVGGLAMTSTMAPVPPRNQHPERS